MKLRMMIGGFKMNPILYSYTGYYQTFTAPATGKYKIECWGAQGECIGGHGGYVAGSIRLNKGEVLYIYVGAAAAFNGGGAGGTIPDTNDRQGIGGGATDIRLTPGVWNALEGLRSRVMVAAGGGGASSWNYRGGGTAGGLIGNKYDSSNCTAGTQISGGKGYISNGVGNWANGSNGSFGFGGVGGIARTGGGSGGGGGYYGGGGGGTNTYFIGYGAGGSSFISGHAGCDAINSSGSHTGQPNHYSGKTFIDTLMIDGSGFQWTTGKGSLMLMPNPLGGTYASGAGHTSNGYCRISKAA